MLRKLYKPYYAILMLIASGDVVVAASHHRVGSTIICSICWLIIFGCYLTSREIHKGDK